MIEEARGDLLQEAEELRGAWRVLQENPIWEALMASLHRSADAHRRAAGTWGTSGEDALRAQGAALAFEQAAGEGRRELDARLRVLDEKVALWAARKEEDDGTAKAAAGDGVPGAGGGGPGRFGP